ncbi:MAG: hypothetical protein CL489_06490 [Acidobacteria bacterium]|nr:hypothetical protein [Acidobacteriota bacterium]|tara:strand:- start:484 stop:1095 length:612 start_codon:yes stop_codon:yes gene_type:complete
MAKPMAKYSMSAPVPGGFKPGSIQAMIMANALHVFNGGSLGLKGAGMTIGGMWKQTIQNLYSSFGSGRSYYHKRLGKVVLASQEGDPPAYQTGKLYDSVDFIVSSLPVRGPGGMMMKGFGKTAIEIFSYLDYAAQLEEGGYPGPSGRYTVAARPAWMPTVMSADMQNQVHNIAKGAFIAAEIQAAQTARTAPMHTIFFREQFR